MFIIEFEVYCCVRRRTLCISYVSDRPYVPAPVKPRGQSAKHNKFGSCSYGDYFSQGH